MIDYRGYGGSEGTPTESGLKLDAEAAFEWVRSSLQYPKDDPLRPGETILQQQQDAMGKATPA